MYRTKSGDTWDSIAYEQYGDERKMKVLMRANPMYLTIEIFPEGILLNLPEVSSTAVNSQVPPWRRL
ncbi:tail protein X [Vallitaleaceae bacterium 9-2]